jgi:hypothetical protein
MTFGRYPACVPAIPTFLFKKGVSVSRYPLILTNEVVSCLSRQSVPVRSQASVPSRPPNEATPIPVPFFLIPSGRTNQRPLRRTTVVPQGNQETRDRNDPSLFVPPRQRNGDQRTTINAVCLRVNRLPQLTYLNNSCHDKLLR